MSTYFYYIINKENACLVERLRWVQQEDAELWAYIEAAKNGTANSSFIIRKDLFI